MGKLHNTSGGVRSAFAAIAVAIGLGSLTAPAHSIPHPSINGPSATGSFLKALIQQATPTDADYKKLDDLHKQAVVNIAKRSASRCVKQPAAKGNPLPDTSNVAKILAFDEYLGKMPREQAALVKITAIQTDLAQYTICIDQRLSKGPYAAAIYFADSTISLNPTTSDPAKPMHSQQQALALTFQGLQQIRAKGVPRELHYKPISVSIHSLTYQTELVIDPWSTQNLLPPPVKGFSQPDLPEDKKRYFNFTALHS